MDAPGKQAPEALPRASGTCGTRQVSQLAGATEPAGALAEVRSALAAKEVALAAAQAQLAAARDDALRLQTALREAQARAAGLLQEAPARPARRLAAPLRWLAQRLGGPAEQASSPPRASLLAGGLTRLRNDIDRTLRYRRQHGIAATAREIMARLGGRPTRPPAGSMAPAAMAPALAGSQAVDALSFVAGHFQPCSPLKLQLLPAGDGPRLSMVTDSINAGTLYGGVGTAILLACHLAQARGARLRIVTRLERALPDSLAGLLSTYGVRLDEGVEFAYAPVDGDSGALDVMPGELFLTTSWWTTAAALAALPGERILYLLQEDERMFYPFGDAHLRCSRVLASRGIRFAVNSRLLFDHLVASGLDNVRERGTCFEPAFPPSVFHPRPRAAGSRRTFLFYARPQNARNLFLFGLEVIEAAVARGVLDPAAWDFVFIGRGIPAVRFGQGAVQPRRLETLRWSEYAELAGQVDLALSLMYTPHPSYPPFDLAASGAVVVTNRFANKQDLGGYCRNILCSDLDLQAMLDTLAEGVRLAQSPERQANHAASTLGRSWAEALAPVIARHA